MEKCRDDDAFFPYSFDFFPLSLYLISPVYLYLVYIYTEILIQLLGLSFINNLTIVTVLLFVFSYCDLVSFDIIQLDLLFAVINSTYQSNDLSHGTEEDVLYQSDASFSAKLDNSYSHNNKQSYNKSVSNGDNIQSSSSVNNLNRNSKNSRHNKSINVKNISNNSKLNKSEASKGANKQLTANSAANQNSVHTEDDKRNVDFFNTIFDWNQDIDTHQLQLKTEEGTSDNINNGYGYSAIDAESGWLKFIPFFLFRFRYDQKLRVDSQVEKN